MATRVTECLDDHADCDEMMGWAMEIARLIEIGKGLSNQERERFQQELREGDPLARAVADEIRRYKSGRWGTQAMHDRAVARLKEHEEWKRVWGPIKKARR